MRIEIESDDLSESQLQLMISCVLESIDEHMMCEDTSCNAKSLQKHILVEKLIEMLNRKELDNGWMDRFGDSWKRRGIWGA